jgi:DNA-binding Lrp family transcriptional regulator
MSGLPLRLTGFHHRRRRWEAGISVDKIDLHIMSSLHANCRTPYRTIASTLGISANAVKTRVNKMVPKGIIQKFVVMVNPAIFGYEKHCFLIVRNIRKKKDISSVI